MSKFADSNILIIDDEPGIVKLFQLIFQRAGFRNLRVAKSGKDALSMVDGDDGFKPDAVVLDLVLPDITGFDLCVSLKKALGRNVGVILITGMDIEDIHARCIEAGADDFMLKPVEPVELVTRVKLLLQRRRAATRDLIPSVSEPVTAAKSHPALPNVGDMIDDRYRIVELLTWSGSSLIYRAVDSEDHQECVIKLLTAQAAEYSEVVQRFVRECETLAKIDDEHVIQLRGQGTLDNRPYSVMEYVPGKNLEVVIEESGPLPFEMVMKVAEGVAKGVLCAHRLGIIHRDIKPKNVFLSDDGPVKLGDFGIALKVGSQRLTQPGYSLGTPVYMAPEQFNSEETTPATDIYSYGVTLYHLIAGEPPFAAQNAIELMRKHNEEAPPSLVMYRLGVPEEWDDFIIRRCLAKQVNARPQSMEEVLGLLDGLRDVSF